MLGRRSGATPSRREGIGRLLGNDVRFRIFPRRQLRVDDRMLLGARPRRLYHANRGNSIIDLHWHWTAA
jgi:hypothetical protein